MPSETNNNNQDFPLSELLTFIDSSFKWPKMDSSTTKLQYTFLAAESSLYPEQLDTQPRFVSRRKGLFSVGEDATLIEKSFRFLENATHLQFVKDDQKPDVSFFKFGERKLFFSKETIVGYATKPDFDQKNLIHVGFNIDYFNECSSFIKQMAIYHEMGHVLTLQHVFNYYGRFSKNAYKTLTTYSILNYQNEYDHAGYEMIPITPMPIDIDALQYLYGVNEKTNAGDTIHHLKDNLPQKTSSSYKTIATLEWDNGGIDTLDAKGIKDDANIDLRPYARSEFKTGYVILPNNDIENVISNEGKNKITLNALNNTVDIRESAQSTIVIDAKKVGHDTIIGFNPEKDKIIFKHQPSESPPGPLIFEKIPSQKIVLAGEEITCETNIKIKLDQENSVTLACPKQNELKPDSIVMEEDPHLIRERAPFNYTKQNEIADTLWNIFSEFPTELFSDFKNAFLQGALITFFTTLTETQLKKYGCNPLQIQIATQAMQALLTLYTGSILSSAAACLTTSLFKYFNFSNEKAQVAGTTVSGGVQALQAFTPLGVAKTITSLAGGYCGCKFTLWAKNKMFPPAFDKNKKYDGPEKELKEIVLRY